MQRVDAQMSQVSPDEAIDEAMGIVDFLLRRKGRALTSAQRSVMKEKVGEERQKTALYITLVVGVVSKWT